MMTSIPSVPAMRLPRRVSQQALIAVAALLLAGCAQSPDALPAVRPDDAAIRYSDSGIVKLESISTMTIIAVDGEEAECPRRCAAGLRLPLGRHRVTIMQAGLAGSEATVEVLIEPRRIYEIRRVDATFGVLDLGEPAHR